MAIIGFIGLGAMGRPMAVNLIKAGHKLVVYDKFAKFDDLLSLGAEGAVSNKDLASKSEIIITILPNPAQVKEAILGAGGVAEGLKKGSIVVDMSSTSPDVCLEVGAAIEAKNSNFLDAPILDGESGVIDGTLTIIAGGDKAAFEKVKPILSKMGSHVILAGGLGAGNMVKLVNQIVAALKIAAFTEVLVLAGRAGINPKQMLDAILDELAEPRTVDDRLSMILDGSLKSGLQIELLLNNLQNTLNSAKFTGEPLPLTVTLMEVLQSLTLDGMAANDYNAIVKYYEKLAKADGKKQ